MNKLMIAALFLICVVANVQAEINPVKFLNTPVSGSLSKFVSSLSSQGFEVINKSESVILKGEFLGRDVLVYPTVNRKNELWKVSVIFGSDYTEEEAVNAYNKFHTMFLENDNYKLKSGTVISPYTYGSVPYNAHHALGNYVTNGSTFNQMLNNNEGINEKSFIKMWIAPSAFMNDMYNIIVVYENLNNKTARPDF